MGNVRKAVSYLSAFAAAVLLATVFSYSFAGNGNANEYVGSDKCKQCHEAKWKAHSIWSASKHAKAFDNLATDEAKKIAADAQTNEKCLKCHTTASAKEDVKAKSFDSKKGVQCEACHGPGKNHIDARNSDEETPVSDEEIVKKPTEESCKKCHNSESPTFKSFDFKAMWEKIKHPKL